MVDELMSVSPQVDSVKRMKRKTRNTGRTKPLRSMTLRDEYRYRWGNKSLIREENVMNSDLCETY
jgi:hypothetical protein